MWRSMSGGHRFSADRSGTETEHTTFRLGGKRSHYNIERKRIPETPQFCHSLLSLTIVSDLVFTTKMSNITLIRWFE